MILSAINISLMPNGKSTAGRCLYTAKAVLLDHTPGKDVS
jgi:hypothetical protein